MATARLTPQMRRKLQARADAKRESIRVGSRVHVEYEGAGTVTQTDYPSNDPYGFAASVFVQIDNDGATVNAGLSQTSLL